MKSELIKLRHARSIKDFPDLKLEENEFVELAIRRSKIGVILIWTGEAIAAILLVVILAILSGGNIISNLAFNLDPAGRSFLYLVIYILAGSILLAGIIGTYVYNGNRLFVTNKRLIQCTATSLFAKSTNVIDLVSIEDVSFQQSGIVEYLFQLGTLRMSTIGDETTYTLKYVDTPIDELDTITHLVHIEKEKTKNRSSKHQSDPDVPDVVDNTVSAEPASTADVSIPQTPANLPNAKS